MSKFFNSFLNYDRNQSIYPYYSIVTLFMKFIVDYKNIKYFIKIKHLQFFTKGVT